MINLPDFKKKFDYENDFFLSCDTRRIEKFLNHYELLKKTMGVPGGIFEFGVFKGLSFVNLATMRDFLGMNEKIIYGFDTFDEFPKTSYEDDKKKMNEFFTEAGQYSIGIKQLAEVMKNKKLSNFKLIQGNILETLPSFKFDDAVSFVNVDTDVYEPATVILKYIYDHLSKNAIMVFDDYNVFPGETVAVNDFLKNKSEILKKISGIKPVWYIKKE